MVVLAVVFSGFYWIISACISIFVFGKSDIFREIFYPDPYELGMRLSVVFFVVISSIYFKLVIIKRRKLDDRLSKEHGLIPLALDKIGSLVVVSEISGSIIRFNHICERKTGFGFREIEDKNFWDLFLPGETKEDLRKAFRKSNRERFPKECEGYLLTKNRKPCFVKWINELVSDKNNPLNYVISVGVDITEHKQTEEALDESQKYHRDVAENIGLGVALVSGERKILYRNNQMERCFPDKKFSQISICHNVLSNFSDKACDICPTCKTLADGKIHETKMTFLVNERNVTYRVVSYPVDNQENRVIAAVETIKDFTSLDRQEEQSRQNYLAQAVMNSLLRSSLENISLESFLKYSLGIVLSTPWFSSESIGAIYLIEDDPDVLVMRVQKDVPETMQKFYRRIGFNDYLCGVAAASAKIEFTDRFAAGSKGKQSKAKVYGHYFVPIMYFGNILGVMDIYLKEGHIRDRREEDFLRAVADTLAGVIQRKKAEQRLSKINSCFTHLGVEPFENIKHLVMLCSDVLGVRAVCYNRFELVQDQLTSVWQCNAYSNFVKGVKSYGHICYDVIKDENQGAFILQSLLNTPFAKNDSNVSRYKFQTYMGQVVKCRGKPKGVISVFYKRDFSPGDTSKKFLGIIIAAIGVEEERMDANRELKEAYEKLKKTQNSLVQSEKLAALGRFSSGIAHEVKNPLGIILGGMEFLEKKLVSPDKDVETAMKKIKESILKADSIVRNLLRFAMPSKIRAEKVKPEELINDTLALFRYRVSLINIDIKTEFSKEDIYIKIDKNQLQQVLFNLLMNAIEAMSKGGQVKIETFKTLLKKGSKRKEFCVIKISDSGEGISKENLAKLFEPFFTTKRDKKGTGLGLAMSKMIVENHRGFLTIESKEDKGTAVSIKLPLIEDD